MSKLFYFRERILCLWWFWKGMWGQFRRMLRVHLHTFLLIICTKPLSCKKENPKRYTQSHGFYQHTSMLSLLPCFAPIFLCCLPFLIPSNNWTPRPHPNFHDSQEKCIIPLSSHSQQNQMQIGKHHGREWSWCTVVYMKEVLPLELTGAISMEVDDTG